MGYTTYFSGKFDLDKPLTAAHLAYLKKFCNLWVRFGGSEMKTTELQALNDTLTAFFGDKRE
jgi:hypothetical protein